MTWPNSVRNEFEILWANRKTIDEIQAVIPQVPIGTLKKWVQKVKGKGNLNTFKGAKKPANYSARDVRALKIAAVRNGHDSVAKIGELAQFNGCHKTIVKYLKQENLVSIVAAKVPLLKPIHVKKRLRFLQLHAGAYLNYWKSWTFSDESSFHLDCAKGVKRIIIRRNERYLPENVVGTRQLGAGKLMIWSHISYDGIGPLIFISGGIDQRVYIDILSRYVLPHLIRCLNTIGITQRYQDDGASCHDAQAVIDFCARKGIDRPFWPPNSPDLNPIEHVWGWVNNKLTAMKDKPQNIDELKIALTKFWDEITVTSIQNLYKSMGKRMEAVRKAKGWNTKF